MIGSTISPDGAMDPHAGLRRPGDPIETAIGRNSPGLNQGGMNRGWDLIEPTLSHAIPDTDVDQLQDLELMQARLRLWDRSLHRTLAGSTDAAGVGKTIPLYPPERLSMQAGRYKGVVAIATSTFTLCCGERRPPGHGTGTWISEET